MFFLTFAATYLEILRLRPTIIIWLSCFCLLFSGRLSGKTAVPLPGGEKVSAFRGQAAQVDSIMEQVIFYAPFYERIVNHYQAELYIKGRIHIRKKNHLIRFLPSMFRLRKNVREYLMETYNDLNFTAPDIYDQKVKAAVGTAPGFWDMDGRLPEYFHINIYASSLLYDKLLSPVAPNARKYYEFRLDSLLDTPGGMCYKVAFTPKNQSYQLVEGYMLVSDQVWSIREIRFTARSELLRFDNHIRMGKAGADNEFLPEQCDFKARFRFLGNVIDGDYLAVLDYKEISRRNPFEVVAASGKKKYDLSASYTLRRDTMASRRDTSYFNRLRPVPLTGHEDTLYLQYYQRNDTAERVKSPRRKTLEFWGQIGDALTNRYTIDLAKMGSVRCSPLINPLLLSYSSRFGISYRQEFKYNLLLAGDRLFRLVPKLGYNFKEKEFYWSVSSDFYYWPQKRASLHLSVGNGNRIYSSDVLDDLKAMSDSLFDFDKIHLDYFKDLFFKLNHTWEIVNGLTLDVGLTIHRRTEVERSEFVLKFPDMPAVMSAQANSSGSSLFPDFDPTILNKLHHVYSSFAPNVRLTWTPGLYYYMNGKRKVNLRSDYPTLSVCWERGISGVLPNSGTYERVEADLQHAIPLGLMRHLYYRVGWGQFTNQKDLYFVDFANFTRSNLPVGWNDEIGGVFQLLDGRWYNSSREYARAHVMYDTPFLLLSRLRKYTQFVLNERLYLNALVVPHLKPYLEAGYGIGTNLFDVGVFVGFANWKYQEIGCKFTFELFNR